MGRGRGSMGKRRGGEQCFRVCVYVCGCIACPVISGSVTCAAELGLLGFCCLCSLGLRVALCNSGQRRRIKEREKERGSGGNGRSGVVLPWMLLTLAFVPQWSASSGPPVHTEGTI